MLISRGFTEPVLSGDRLFARSRLGNLREFLVSSRATPGGRRTRQGSICSNLESTQAKDTAMSLQAGGLGTG